MTLTRFEKETLMCLALGIERSRLISHPELFDDNDPVYRFFVKRRENNEPLAYLLGSQPFLGQVFLVDRSTLIPRPETEELVELAINIIISSNTQSARYNILDIGTGSGCIAISLARRLPNAVVTATDHSEEALKIARKNAASLNVSDRAIFEKGDLFGNSGKKYDLIISNPPYIATGDIPGLMPDVKDWEPVSALDGGPDGLKYITQIIDQAPVHLNDTGFLLIEFGFNQHKKIKDLSNKYFKRTEIFKDLSGIDRFLLAAEVR